MILMKSVASSMDVIVPTRRWYEKFSKFVDKGGRPRAQGPLLTFRICHIDFKQISWYRWIVGLASSFLGNQYPHRI